MYEVYLAGKEMGTTEWRKLAMRLMAMSRQGEKAELILRFDTGVLAIYLKMDRKVTSQLAGINGVLIRECDEELSAIKVKPTMRPYFVSSRDSVANVAEKLRAMDSELVEMRLIFTKVLSSFVMKAYFVEKRNTSVLMWRQFNASFGLLDVNLKQKFLLKRVPKYLNMAKTLSLASDTRAGAVMEIKTYPYLDGKHYLNLMNYDYNKHTAVFGASGMGKTKFLATMIDRTIKNYGDKYHFLVIDPHDAIRQEIGGTLGVKVLDYGTKDAGVSLFLEGGRDIINDVDMTLALIKTLMGEGWNARLERLTRACLYLLMENGDLSFQNMRKLLTDVTYKNTVVKQVGEYLPESLQEFFLQDYNELKTQYYDMTFARLMAFIDEMQLTPAFYRKNDRRLLHEITENKVTLVSLSQARLGEKPVRVLAGLIMNQLFALGMQRKLMYNMILVVDEVAVVENPILTRFLAEARKYGISVVLAGQYYAQISESLRRAIYANVANYFCFRLNYDDAENLVKYLDVCMDAPDMESVSEAEEVKLLTTLPAREMLVRVERNGVPLPAVRGVSLDFVGVPDAASPVKTLTDREAKKAPSKVPIKNGILNVKSNVFDLMCEQSTSRKKVN